jgi:5-methylcytosine-specific restriction endonuclease McrA
MNLSAEYRQYLLSEKWRYKRIRVIWRDGAACRYCGSRKYIEVHHLTYKNFGNEPLEYLISACKSCHKKIHKRVIHVA